MNSALFLYYGSCTFTERSWTFELMWICILWWCRLSNRSWTPATSHVLLCHSLKRHQQRLMYKCIIEYMYRVLFYYFDYKNSVWYKQIDTLGENFVCYTRDMKETWLVFYTSTHQKRLPLKPETWSNAKIWGSSNPMSETRNFHDGLRGRNVSCKWRRWKRSS